MIDVLHSFEVLIFIPFLFNGGATDLGRRILIENVASVQAQMSGRRTAVYIMDPSEPCVMRFFEGCESGTMPGFFKYAASALVHV